ncbi:MAG: efflux RND transporter periplasmic adaptor subunit [Gemmataceae bacterium]
MIKWVSQIAGFVWSAIPTVGVIGMLLATAYWGMKTEWTFSHLPFGEHPKEISKPGEEEQAGWKVVEGPDKKKIFHKAEIISPSKEAMEQLELTFEKVKKNEILDTVSATANLEFDPQLKGNISARAAGVVAKILKKAGDHVKKGETIAVIDSPEVGKARSDFMQSLVLMDNRKKNLERARNASSVIPERQIREQELAFRETEVKNLADRQVLVNYGINIQSDTLKGLSDSTVFQKICEAGLPAEVLNGKDGEGLSANYLSLIAPFTGTVITVYKGIGETLSATDAQCLLADTGKLILSIRMPLESINQIKKGQKYVFTSDQAPENPIQGTLDWISPEVDEKSRTVQARSNIDNKAGLLRPNTFGKVDVVINRFEQVLTIPEKSLHHLEGKDLVFVRTKEDRFEARVVKVGVRSNGEVQIVDGVAEGEIVVVSGGHLLRSEISSKLELETNE